MCVTEDKQIDAHQKPEEEEKEEDEEEEEQKKKKEAVDREILTETTHHTDVIGVAPRTELALSYCLQKL